MTEEKDPPIAESRGAELLRIQTSMIYLDSKVSRSGRI